MEENKTKIKKDLFRAIRGLKGNSKNRGITLVALVITIIVLLILAGVSIAILLGDNGLLSRAKYAKEKQEQANALEEMSLVVYEAQLRGKGKATLKDVVNILKEDTQNTYIIKTTKSIALLSDKSVIKDVSEVTDELSAIYIINTKYNEEIEITKDLTVTLIGTKQQITEDDNQGTTGDAISKYKESTLISNFDFKVKNSTNTSMTIEPVLSEQSLNNLAGYFVFLNNKVIDVKKDKEILIENLEKNTSYDVKLGAIDVDGNFATTITKSLRTKNMLLLADIIDTSKTQTLELNAYDGNLETNVAMLRDSFKYLYLRDVPSNCYLNVTVKVGGTSDICINCYGNNDTSLYKAFYYTEGANTSSMQADDIQKIDTDTLVTCKVPIPVGTERIGFCKWQTSANVYVYNVEVAQQ